MIRRNPYYYQLSTQALTIVVLVLFAGCGIINPGKWKGIESTDKDEHYWLLSNALLTAGSAAHPRDSFDHTVHRAISVLMTPANEKNHYVTKTIWYDPMGVEYRTIRQTHDKQQEGGTGMDRPKGGAVCLPKSCTNT
jgi:hypothetical protein